MKADKDTLERRLLDSFKAAYTFFPVGTIRKGIPGIEPDFIVENGNEKLGIEMAGLYRDNGKYEFGVNPQAQFQKRVVRDARKLFEKASTKKIRVFVSFKERSKIDNKHIQQLASYLSEVVLKEIANRLPTPNYPIQIGSSCLYQHKEVFSSIYIDAFTTFSDCPWMRNNVNNVELLNENFLLDLIKRKERKYESGNYSGCNGVWLLFYMNYFDPAMDQCTPSNLGFKIELSNFDKVLLYKTITNEVRQLYPLE